MMHPFGKIAALIISIGLCQMAAGRPAKDDIAINQPSNSLNNAIQIAQTDLQNSYDPFSDFSEFQEDAEQEADIHFFKNGRMLNIGLLVGSINYTDKMAKVYKGGMGYGFFLTYFFDLRFAMQFQYLTTQSKYRVANNAGESSGNSELSSFAIDFKYFFNTQNVTRGLAELNPYLILGFASHNRTLSNKGTINIGTEQASGFDLGAGIEFPILDERLFFGLQGMLHIINFKDESTEITVQGLGTGKYGAGDAISFLLVLGSNF